MKKILTYIVILAVAMVAVGCSKSEPPQPDMPNPDVPNPNGYTPSDSPIGFHAEDNWGDANQAQTRGLVTNSINFLNFGVLGYYLPDGSWDSTPKVSASDETPNFMYNQLVQKSGDGWSYSPIKYWSNNPNDSIKFFAYAPHSSHRDGTEISKNTIAGYPSITFTPAVTPTEQRDFMTAQTALHSKTDGAVSFSFSHSLAQLQFCSAHKGAITDKVEILEIEVRGLRGSAIGRFTESGFVWDHQTTSPETPPVQTVNYKLVTKDENSEIFNPDGDINYLTEATTNIDDYSNVTSEYGILLLVPQTAENVKFIVRFKYTTDDVDVVTFQMFSLSKLTLTKNKVKYCLFLIDPTNIGMSDITTTTAAWVDKNVNGEDNPWVVE